MANALLDKSKEFSLLIIQICRKIEKEKHEYVMTKQLLRAGTSIGANIAEAQHAQSRADFYAKLQVALKECEESLYWLDLLVGSGYLDDSDAHDRCTELRKILIAASKTVKKSIETNN